MLELQDDSEQPIALTVLSAMYLVKPLPQLLADLSQEQQLQAAVLADKWQVASIKNAAARLLTDAASTEAGLTEAVKQRVLSAAALPECLQPLLKAVLLPLFGDLEAVWADAGLQEQLLGLPLPAMELLLSRDDLEVTIVLFQSKHKECVGCHLLHCINCCSPLTALVALLSVRIQHVVLPPYEVFKPSVCYAVLLG